jgi:predicted Zn finger-like uncharacterized protein
MVDVMINDDLPRFCCGRSSGRTSGQTTMNVTCSSCHAKYVVPDDKVAGRRIRIRCRHCDAPIIIDGTSIGPSAASHAVAPPAPAAAPSSTPIAAVAHPQDRPRPATPTAGPASSANGIRPRSELADIPRRQSADTSSANWSSLPAAAAPQPAPAAGAQQPRPDTAAWQDSSDAPAADAPAPATDARTGAARRRRARSQFSRTMLGGFRPALGSAPEPPAAAAPVACGAPESPAPSVTTTAVDAQVPSPQFAAAPETFSASEPPTRPVIPPKETGLWVVALPEGELEDTSTQQVVRLYALGRIPDDALLWKEGMSDWRTPFAIPEIKIELLARGFTPPTTVEPEPAMRARPAAAVEPPSSHPVAPLDYGDVRKADARSASTWESRQPAAKPISKRPADDTLPNGWLSLFDRPSHASAIPASDKPALSRSYHPPTSVSPARSAPLLSSVPPQRSAPPPRSLLPPKSTGSSRPLPTTIPAPPPSVSTRPPSPRAPAGAAKAVAVSSRPAPPRARSRAAGSARPAPPRSGRAGAVALPAAAARQQATSDLDIDVDVDDPGSEARPMKPQAPAPACGPALVAPSLQSLTYPQPRRQRTRSWVLLAAACAVTLGVVAVQTTRRPQAVYRAMSAVFDQAKALLHR